MKKKNGSDKRKGPPNSGQFKKGQSGNAKGRPKGSPNLDTVIAKELGRSMLIRESGKAKKVLRVEAVGKTHVAKAILGDAQHTKILFNRMDNIQNKANQFSLGLSDENRTQILERYYQSMRAWIIEELKQERKD